MRLPLIGSWVVVELGLLGGDEYHNACGTR